MSKQFQLKQIDDVANELLQTQKSKTFCFFGQMGAGKTTLIKALVKKLGSADEVSSPTFGLVNEYHSPKGEVLAYHFDFYRINDETEAMDIGFEEYLASNTHVFIEWPELIPNLLPDDVNQVHIDIQDENTRHIRFSS
ncbi:MAG: tRNA (adenosine(37)-N6)-threonylcarbamoyltransferase complex ATPase subunit type 1 TsaE [Croceitalea sp.]|nr:tRNA (adenosine(37)-N6)-threonylcarbamoyltransferase complex ATPase subunit type 1 TsaE [Croceitalea sp.]MBT8237657.1 tRNA (adenosine(37)-N6)-threonylcarbamoyltransferase complex ATPase subunit type 1 TsaE [Croceitalea sp.]NNC34785.1 tRNA (adenosine(37)-N6)-threonylcarbamoyltransferase complex ATPase subunit type 1 TsaE [Croceitalea sp.]NNL07924.1 tRNA (adenosine(37)-N6)-threonylcarbamoyltransferase complex ATPase subunit type 1 TsaE [Croceitalea sp.]NNM17270.1 tRNA (adenosine(37)-N6)-threon